MIPQEVLILLSFKILVDFLNSDGLRDFDHISISLQNVVMAPRLQPQPSHGDADNTLMSNPGESPMLRILIKCKVGTSYC